MKTTKNNKLSQIKSLTESMIPLMQELQYGEGEEAFIVKVYPALPFTKRTEMVREIVDGVFMSDRNSIDTYMPEFLQLMQKFTALKYFTDIDLPTKIDELWFVLNYAPIYDDVVKIIGDNLTSIFDDADKAIEARKNYLISKTDFNSMFGRIGDFFKGLESKISPEDIEKMMNSLKEMSNGTMPSDIVNTLLNVKNGDLQTSV